MKRIDGIKYFSVEANLSSNVDLSHLINYAIPVKEISSSGYCTFLKSAFLLTAPYSFEMLEIVDRNILQFDKEKFSNNTRKLMHNNSLAFLEFPMNEKLINYWSSEFGKIEIESCEKEYKKI
jgi:hypothetical protein